MGWRWRAAAGLALLLGLLAGCGQDEPIAYDLPVIVPATAYPIVPRSEQVLLALGGHERWHRLGSEQFLDAELNRTCLDLAGTTDRTGQIETVQDDLPDLQPGAEEAARILDKLTGGLCSAPPATERTTPPAEVHHPVVGPGAES